MDTLVRTGPEQFQPPFWGNHKTGSIQDYRHLSLRQIPSRMLPSRWRVVAPNLRLGQRPHLSRTTRQPFRYKGCGLRRRPKRAAIHHNSYDTGVTLHFGSFQPGVRGGKTEVKDMIRRSWLRKLVSCRTAFRRYSFWLTKTGCVEIRVRKGELESSFKPSKKVDPAQKMTLTLQCQHKVYGLRENPNGHKWTQSPKS